MKMRWKLLGAAAGLCLASMSRATTQYSYIAQPQGGRIVSGANNTINLYLQEVSTGGSFTATQDGGLYSGGVAFVEQAGGFGVTFTAAGVSNNSAAEPAGFSGNNTKGLLTSGGVWVADITANSASAGVQPISSATSGGTTTNLYLLGSVTFGLAADNQFDAAFLVESLHDAPKNDGIPAAGADGNTLTFNSGMDLDNGTPAGTTGADGNPTPFVPEAQLPEPASLAIFGLAGAGLLMRRRSAADH
jgi:hypothetical protein